MPKSRDDCASRFKVIGLGEILWDLLPDGKQLGGAPANFAYHAQGLGAEALVISRVGSDADGKEILERLDELNLRSLMQVEEERPTGTVSVTIVEGQPEYVIHENVAWDRLEAGRNDFEAVSEADAICFGTLAQRTETSRGAIHALVGASPAKAIRIFDANLRQRYFTREIIESSLGLANVLKVNDGELEMIAEMFGIAGDSRTQMRGLAERFELETVACTRGASGSVLWSRGEWSDHPGVPAKVVDTIGAGDSFTAALCIGLLRGWTLDRINARANEVAAFVASSRGGTPVMPEKIRGSFIE